MINYCCFIYTGAGRTSYLAAGGVLCGRRALPLPSKRLAPSLTAIDERSGKIESQPVATRAATVASLLRPALAGLTLPGANRRSLFG